MLASLMCHLSLYLCVCVGGCRRVCIQHMEPCRLSVLINDLVLLIFCFKCLPGEEERKRLDRGGGGGDEWVGGIRWFPGVGKERQL